MFRDGLRQFKRQRSILESLSKIQDVLTKYFRNDTNVRRLFSFHEMQVGLDEPYTMRSPAACVLGPGDCLH